MYHFFKSTFFNFEYTRVLTTIPFGGAEIGECLDAATQIKNDDPESWHRAWYTQAERAETLAHAAASRGDAISARDAYLRAANYFRASQYMFNDRLDSPEARVLPLFNRSVANFLHAIKLLDHSVQLLQIPYENDHTLPGYLFLPHPSKRLPGKIPVLVNCNGADSTSEELYSLYPAAGCDRGYAVVSFDGPGQGMVLRQDKLRMRPDWEVVTSRVLDHIHELAKTQPELDLDIDRVAVAGASMGAYYALRAASDPRYAACISIDPFYDMFDLATSRMPPWFIHLWLAGYITDGMFNATWRFLSRFAFQLKWELEHVMWIFGKKDAASAMREMRRYTLRLVDTEEPDRKNDHNDDDDDDGCGKGKEFLENIKCPVFVTGAANTIYTSPEISTDRVYAALGHLGDNGERRRWVASEVGEGGLQAKVGAWRLVQQRSFAFLDEVLGVRRERLGLDN